MAGLEVLFAVAKEHITSQNDALVCCLHWNMIASGYRCIGSGEEVSQNAEKSELLPTGWNASQDVYALLYQPSDSEDTHLLKCIAVDGSMLVHILRTRNNQVTNMNITVSEYVTSDLSYFKSAYKNLDELQKQFKKDLLESPAAAQSTTTDQRERTETRRQDEDSDPLRVPGRSSRQPPPDWYRLLTYYRPQTKFGARAEQRDPFAVGTGDLDPLAGGMGGGMLMDPRRGFPGPGRPRPGVGLPGRLPPGAVLPGARFDPFGPDVDGSGHFNPGSGNRAGPDPDHLPPPGYDDMFM